MNFRIQKVQKTFCYICFGIPLKESGHFFPLGIWFRCSNEYDVPGWKLHIGFILGEFCLQKAFPCWHSEAITNRILLGVLPKRIEAYGFITQRFVWSKETVVKTKGAYSK